MTTRDRLMVLLLAIAALAAAGWFLVLSPMRGEASDLSAQIDTQRAALEQALADAAAGAQARRAYGRHYATVARLGAAVPEDDNVASLLVQVEQAADASAIDFRSLKIGQGSGAAAPAPPPPPAAGGASTSQATTATLPPGALVGTAGFPTMPFSFAFEGDFFRLSGFIGRLERFLVVRQQTLAVGGRFIAIDGIGLNAAPEGFPRIQANVASTSYLLPASQGLTAGASAGGPTPASDDTGAPPADTASGGGVSAPAATATPVMP
ncbi:MAG TPA: type II secretion system protein GspM [Conexibacter sp.]|nr:type II secretion system protein GspM [Conexibacter sp.]